MHLYDGGVPLPYIRDILGHVELATTDIYARASTEAKRKALEAAYTDVASDDLPEWNQDAGLPQLARQPVSPARIKKRVMRSGRSPASLSPGRAGQRCA